MKLPQLPLKIFLAITSILIATESVRSQSGNMSDITLPSPDAIISEPPVEGETPPEVVDSETPTEVVDGETPEVVDGETPTEVVDGEIPSEVVDGETPEIVDGETPEIVDSETPEIVDGEIPSEVVDGETPEIVDGETPEIVDGETPEIVDGETPEVVDGETPEIVDGETPEVVDGETPEIVDGETPEVVDGETPEVVDGETPEVVDGEIPSEVVDGEIPTEVVDGETPEVVDGETPEIVDGETPEIVDGETPEIVDSETPEVVDGETPEVVDSETPEVVDGETPEVVDGETPEVVDGETPEVVDGETPSEIVDGETPSEIVDGETPSEIVDGETPSEVVENTPSDASDSNFTAQDLELGKNATDDLLTEENSTSDVIETSNTNSDSEIEAPDSLDSEPANIEAEITETELVNTESEVVEAEAVTPDQEEVSVEADANATSEAQDLEESTESSEIVEELLEEAELRDAKNSLEADEEVEIEETSSAEIEEEVEIEETSSAEIEEESEIEETSPEEEKEVAEEKSAEPDLGQLDRVAYETQFQEAPNDLAILMQEEFQLTELIGSSGLELYGTIPSVKNISSRLAQLAKQTGKKPAFINISLQSNQLESFVVLPEQTLANAESSVVASSELNHLDSPQSQALTVRKTVKDTSRKDLLATATQFREEVSDIRKLGQASYMASAQELYEILIKPIEAELEANDIDILVFSMDSGLRLLPVAALHDGEQFLVEKYAMGIVPSFGLTDTRYVSPEQSSILAMGASEFEEQVALPTMPIELSTIVGTPRQGELFLNEQFTISNFVAQNSRETPFSIIHLGTHAEFKAGNRNDSYIQFYDDKLKIPQLQKLSDQLGWNTDATPIELLVLSACETALGDKEAELGFAGLAVQAGVKSALASLWYVSDLGTLALMGEFYDQLDNTLIKAEALRQTQLEMLRGNVKVDERQVKLSNGAGLALPEDFPDGTLTLAHPYFWSSFTLIGNWN